jgi:cardiolipin synthase
MAPMIASLPNLITLLRLLSVPLTIYLILAGELTGAFWLFVAAGVSDAVDGAIARLCNARTVLGGFLDPLADKALLVSVYLCLSKDGLIPLWLVVLVVSRDLLIVGGVLLAYTLSHPVAMRPLLISKANTFAQLALAALVLAEGGLGLTLPGPGGTGISVVLSWVVAATTVLSGGAYLLGSDWLFRRPGGAGG